MGFCPSVLFDYAETDRQLGSVVEHWGSARLLSVAFGCIVLLSAEPHSRSGSNMDATQRSLIHAAGQDGATSTGMRVFTQARPWFLFCLYFQLLSVNAGF